MSRDPNGTLPPPTFTAHDYAIREPEGCGVFGVFNHPQAAGLTALGLHALQHRGQESAGLATSDGAAMRLLKGQGLVAEIMRPEKLAEMQGHIAIGHVRYSTTGASHGANAQPLMANTRGGHVAVSHNGNLTNAAELAEALEANGAIFQSTTDSELMLHLIAQNRDPDFLDALCHAVRRLHGAYSVALLREKEMWAFRDPHGFRPLCLGSLGDNGWVVASESCALDIVGANYLRELKPGEVVVFREGGQVETFFPHETTSETFCVFEIVYYSRPDSRIGNSSIYQFRLRIGAELAREHPAAADFVIAIPDSSTAAAIGYARELGLTMEMGLVRSHYVGRTFIAPDQAKRDMGARMKYNPVREVLKGKRVAVIDDSIVRGTTARKLMRMIREAGAKEIHLRISSPPWKYPCYYGIDTPADDKLLASQRTVEEMQEQLEVESLGFLSREGLMRSVPPTINYCSACFTGRYPDLRPNRPTKNVLEKRP